MTYTLITRQTQTPRSIPYLALTALVLLMGCGSHDADVAGASMSEQTEASDSAVGSSTSPNANEDVLLGTSTGVFDADAKGRTAETAVANQVSTTNHRSGERLEARFLTTDDGQMTWQGWQDADLGAECSFQLDDQGTLRCFPSNGTEQLYYSNAECTRGFVNAASVTQAQPAYYYYRKDTECGEGIRAYDVADTSEELTTVYVRNAQHECVATNAAGLAFRALQAPVDPSHFVAADYGVIESSARIKGYGLIAEDGAVQMLGFMDDELDAPCMWTGADTASCVPHGQVIDRFADPEMSIPLMKNQTTHCADPMSTVGVQPAAGGTARYFRRGTPFEGSMVYGMVPQSAVGPAAMAVQDTYYRTEEIAVNGFATATVVSEVTSRLNPVYWSVDADNTWFGHWYDLALGSSCTFVPDGKDSALCLPDTTGSRIVYTDAACAEPVAEIDANCGDARPQFAMEHVEGDGDSQVNVRRLVAATPLQAFYDVTDTGCVLRTARSDKQYFDLSAPLPAEAFVSARTVAVDAPANADEETSDPLR
jgi:hypothetical protein